MTKEDWIKIANDNAYIHSKIRMDKLDEIKTERPDIWKRMKSGKEALKDILPKG
jgi:hypothetical protein